MQLSVLEQMEKFRRLPAGDRTLLFEALLCLAVARFAILFLPFRHIGRLAAYRVHRLEPSQAARLEAVSRVRWAVIAWAIRVPWRAMCFERGLAAQLMLRRRGVRSVLYFGAKPDHQHGLVAHVWVRDREIDVIGCDVSPSFAILVRFPSSGKEAEFENRSSARVPSGAPQQAQQSHGSPEQGI